MKSHFWNIHYKKNLQRWKSTEFNRFVIPNQYSPGIKRFTVSFRSILYYQRLVLWRQYFFFRYAHETPLRIKFDCRVEGQRSRPSPIFNHWTYTLENQYLLPMICKSICGWFLLSSGSRMQALLSRFEKAIDFYTERLIQYA